MAAVTAETFTRAYISLASDLSEKVAVGRRSGSTSTGVTGEVRQYAGGRLRVISRAGRPGQTALSFRAPDRTVIETLQSWVGQTVLVRDELGRGEFVVFFEVPEADLDMGWVDVDLTFQHVTHSLEV